MNKEFTNSDWNNYLRKYNKVYRIKKEKDCVYQLSCRSTVKKGLYSANICPFSLRDKYLLFSLFVQNRRLNCKPKGEKLKSIGIWYRIEQQAEDFYSIIFKESDLKKVEDIFKIRKKWTVSPSRKEILVKQLQDAREVKQNG